MSHFETRLERMGHMQKSIMETSSRVSHARHALSELEQQLKCQRTSFDMYEADVRSMVDAVHARYANGEMTVFEYYQEIKAIMSVID